MFAFVAVFALMFGGGAASAQVVQVPCSAFTQTPLVCINNMSAWAVSYIECDGYRVNVVGLTGGFVLGHSVGVAKFPKSFCQTVIVHTTDGRVRGGLFMDAKNSVSFTISPW